MPSQSSSYMHIHLLFTGGFESVFACWFTYLSWHIAGFVTLAKFQNAQIAKIYGVHVCPQANKHTHTSAMDPASIAWERGYARS